MESTGVENTASIATNYEIIKEEPKLEPDQQDIGAQLPPQQQQQTARPQAQQERNYDDVEGKIFIGGLSWQTTEGVIVIVD